MISQLSLDECAVNVVAQWSVYITLIPYENLSLFSMFVLHSEEAYFALTVFTGSHIIINAKLMDYLRFGKAQAGFVCLLFSP